MTHQIIHTFTCNKCKKPVDTIWDDNEDGTTEGYITHPDYVIVADWAFHSSCWDELVKDYTP